MNARDTRFALRHLCAGISLAGCLYGSAALAEEFTFDLPAQPMASALTALARQGQLQILFQEAQLHDLEAPALSGRFTPRQALERLLARSGFELLEAGEGFVVRSASNGVPSAAGERGNALLLGGTSILGQRIDGDSAGRSTLQREDIERQQADNIAALLDTLPGVSASGSPRPGGQTLNIWGMGDVEDVKVILDGAPKGFEKYRQGSVFIEPELIKHIEVDKGPHSTLYGNGGFAGVIRVDTKDPADMLREGRNSGAFVKYGYHSNDRQQIYSGAVFGQTEDRRLDALLYMSGRDGDDIERPDGTRFAYSSNSLGGFLFKSNLRPSEEHLISLSVMQTNSNAWEPFAAKRDDLPAPSAAEIERYGLDGAWKRKLVKRDQDDENYALKWNYTPLDNPLINLTASFAYSQTSQHDKRPEIASAGFAASLGNESWVDYSDRLGELKNESLFSTGLFEHALTVGVQWHAHERDTLMFDRSKVNDATYNHGLYQPYYMPSGEQETRSAFLQDAITLGALTITPALRYDQVITRGEASLAPRYNNPDPRYGHDYRSVSYTGWSPRLGIFWTASENLAFFADFSKTWRAPLIDESYEVQSAVSSVPATSRGLDPERIRGIRLGSIASFDGLLRADDSLQIRTTLFQNRGKDEIFKRTGISCLEQIQTGSGNGICAQPLSNQRNLPGYTIEGVEVESFYDSPRLFGSLSLSYIRGQRDASPRNPWGPRTWIAEIPPRKAVATLGVKVPEADMAFGWTGHFVRRQDRSPTDDDPLASGWSLPKSQGYALHGLFASWQPTQLDGFEARLAVDNLFNREYYPYLGESVSGVGRNIKVSVSQFF
ncbi:TonB-dependent receptor [Phytopseudomonas dryadis]|uniref:TonB-dependent receptor n=1 Tax=Phytopseudomonas dryadis TaxID=2487520 RepID=A0A4Q9R2A2_9GAMM|nr:MULTISPECIES: TonB-dependent receptor [Pseudomonas]TBU93413.1 TonB-dependent receptor [Pseudomonas dryadis]TBV07079.1 TonB-dependent receptor [Pseudomonas dryadis]TBV19528.1 TonB-dependent receptor [Pseudomonas sp. FRB 230]